MQAITSGSTVFDSEQRTSFTLEYWNTPFPVLHNDVASAGIEFDVREPRASDGVYSVRAQVEAAAATAALTAWDNASYSDEVIDNGRTANVIGYWAGGAPGYHGASVNGRVAYRFKCVLRSVTGRNWFEGTATPDFKLLLGGNGYFRVIKKRAGQSEVNVQDVDGADINYDITEDDFLRDGLVESELISDMAAGDYLDIYYIQDREDWGGFVVKVVQSTDPTDDEIRNAPVLGCGFMDDGSPPSKQTLKMVSGVDIRHGLKTSAQMQFRVPLINTQVDDEVGWEWTRTSAATDPGYLVQHNADGTTVTVRRQRVVKLSGGFANDHYTLFTGILDDWDEPQGGEVPVTCTGFDQRLRDQFMKNYPDRISYMMFNYKKLSGASEPVYGTTAFDNWPLEYAVRSVAVRGGVDESTVFQDLTVPLSDGTTSTVVQGGETYQKFRARSLGGTLLRLERNPHYGNVGLAFDRKLPEDDKYLFAPENTTEMWGAVAELVDRYGYDVRFDEFGHFVLRPRNKPHYVEDLTTSLAGGTVEEKYTPSAYAGTYLEYTGVISGADTTVTAARIDICLPRGAALGNWTFVVKQGVTTVNSGTLSGLASTTTTHFYDQRYTTDGENATVVTLYSGDYDEYTVELDSTGGDGSTKRWVDCLLLYHTDPDLPLYPATLATTANALSVKTKASMDDMRNYVIVVGRRKAVVTDSDKIVTNPENPESEFIVESAVDIGSITDSTATNYIGFPKESIIFDANVNDLDFARYLAQTFIFRQRIPKPVATIEHTILPVVQLRDPLYAYEEGYNTIDTQTTLYVTEYVHSFNDGKATTSITTTSYPEFPSYEPREDVDIDANFSGDPVANMEISYTSLSNHTKTNLGPDAVHISENGEDLVILNDVTISAGTPKYIDFSGASQPWPPLPGTVQFRKAATSSESSSSQNQTLPRAEFIMRRAIQLPNMKVDENGAPDSITNFLYEEWASDGNIINTQWASLGKGSVTQDATSKYYWVWNNISKTLYIYGPSDARYTSFTFTYVRLDEVSGATDWYADNPYQHFTNVDYRDANRRIEFPFLYGDTNTSQMPTAWTKLDIRYRKLGPVDGSGNFSAPSVYSSGCPFYDPYTSEIGHFINISFDALISGYYRISIRSAVDDTIVAWLTSPTTSPQDIEAHWDYLEAGTDKLYAWDGVDQLGIWNAKQSQDYSAMAQGVFAQDERQIIGAGYYVWNNELSNRWALISADRDATSSKPVFGQGPFGVWYVCVEAKNDTLEALADADASLAYPRVVKTNEVTDITTRFTSSDTSAHIYTHLPEPTHVDVEIKDWQQGTAGDFDETDQSAIDTEGNWGALDTDATINNQQPVRLRFEVMARPGTLWSGNEDQALLQLHRQVHLRRTLMDQFVVYTGKTFQGFQWDERTVVNRHLTNDDHTIVFDDSSFRRAESLKAFDGTTGTVEWIFLPKYFKKDFRGRGYAQELQFGDYLQLEEVPSWNPARAIGSERSRFNIAFMSDLFYFSAYTTDLSGRSMWAIRRKFLDKSKILKNAYSDWWDEASTPRTAASSTTYRNQWPEDHMSEHRRSIFVRQWTDEGTWRADQNTQWSFGGAGYIGYELLKHKWEDHAPDATTLNGTAWTTFSLSTDNRSKWHRDGRTELPSQFSALARQLGGDHLTAPTTHLSSWTWEGAGDGTAWLPCITRDFHGFFQLPPMVANASDSSNNIYTQADGGETYNPYDSGDETGDDPAFGDGRWNSVTAAMTTAYSSAGNSMTRFRPGTEVNYEEYKNLMTADVHNYLRQQELVRYEDIRGLWSHGKRPEQSPIKVMPGNPYYSNWYRYSSWVVEQNEDVTGVPVYSAGVSNWFKYSFRHEYLWESASMFPTDKFGKPLHFLVHRRLLRDELDGTTASSVRYDGGAWAGWKDDKTNSGEGDAAYSLTHSEGTATLFSTGNTGPMAALGPELATTRQVYMHMTLVNARRDTEI